MDFDTARETAVAYIGIDFSKSSGRVRQNLLKKGAGEDIAEDVIRYLQEIDYIDDFRAASRIAQRYRGRKSRSRRAMIQIFVQNGIPYETAGEASKRLNPDDVSALELLASSFEDAPDDAGQEAMMKLLFRRGYSMDAARRSVLSFLSGTSLTMD